MRTIAIINQKGGSGKTTTAINLAAALARIGKRVLLVDLDPQSHCALGLAIPEAQIDLHVGDLMLAPDHRPIDRNRLIWKTARGLDIIPSTTRLAGLESARGGLADREDRDRRLAASLAPFAPHYDWCFLDCPPFIGLLTFNALRAADEVLIPVETAYFALQGATKQVNTIRALGRRFGSITPYRVLPTLHEHRSALASDVLRELERLFENALIPLTIRYDAKLKEAACAGVPLVEHDPASAGSSDYSDLAAFYETAPRLAPEIVVEPPLPELIESAPAQPPITPRTADEPQPVAGPAPIPEALAFTRAPSLLNRAAELAERARRLSARSAEITEKLEEDPGVSRVLRELERAAERPVLRLTGTPADPAPTPAPAPAPAAPAETFNAPVAAPLAGVRITSRGVLFLHPAGPDTHVALVGDHNDWDPAGTPLRYNGAAGIHEACMALPPGRYRYRLLIDGQRRPDPFNPLFEKNEFGELDSIVVVPLESEARPPAAPPAAAIA
ncbi:MAG: AAA family ATPase [Planctomycetota bacterium]|nr:AAA family ATPase [Planctomycetota bacterium]